MYVLLGTSRHNSIGAFAVVCVMTSQVVIKTRLALDLNEEDTVNITAATSLLTGVFLLIFGALKAGVLSVFLSNQFVSGFTAAVSVHIGTSQLGGLFGFEVEHFSGPFILVNVRLSTKLVFDFQMSCAAFYVHLFCGCRGH